MRRLLLGTLIIVLILGALGCGKKPPVTKSLKSPETKTTDHQDQSQGKTEHGPDQRGAAGWADEQEKRAQEHQQYVKINVKGYEWFAHASNGTSGVPFILIRLLPELEPDTWGPPEEEFARFGYVRTRSDSGRPLPTALAWDTLIRGENAPKLIPALAQGIQAGRYAVEKELPTNYSMPNHPPLDGGTFRQSVGSRDLIVLDKQRKLDWSGDENKESLNDLIEYFKTL